MIKNLLQEKYGKYVTKKFLTDHNEVIRYNDNVERESDQLEIKKHLKSLKDSEGNPLVPEKFWLNDVKWGFDFSSWIGNISNKDFFIIGAEPHIRRNYQLVYDFGNLKGKSLQESALKHYNRKDDIWHYLTNIFTDDKPENITKFLDRCYITDLCHIVPQNCGQIKSICDTLNITTKDWKSFRLSVANMFLLKEIRSVAPKYIILHGNASRDFFRNEFDISDYHVFNIKDSKFTIQTWDWDGYKVISIPHLKGDMKNKLWKCEKFPNRPKSAKQILNELIKASKV